MQTQEEYLKDSEPDYYHKQSDTEYGSSVFTVESYMTSGDIKESDPVYQEIRNIVEDISDGVQDAPDISDGVQDAPDISEETEVIKHFDEKEHQKNIFVTESNVTNNKPSIVYGIITAKEVAKYRPSTPNIIRR